MKSFLALVSLAALTLGLLTVGASPGADFLRSADAEHSTISAAQPDTAMPFVAAAALVPVAVAASHTGVRRLRVGVSLGRFVAVVRRAARVVAMHAGIGLVHCLDLIDQTLGIRFPWAMGVSAFTKLADLWVPEVLTQGLAEPIIERTAFLDSGVVAASPELTQIVTDGRGTEIEIPFLIEPNHDDQQQTEDTAPDVKKLSSGLQRAALFRRVSPLGATTLSGVISGVKPGGDILQALLNSVFSLRKRQRNRLVLAQLSGLFNVAGVPNVNAGAFKALRYDKFLEDGGTPISANLIDSSMMLKAIALMGEEKEVLTGGAILMHSDIEAVLTDQDQIDVIRNSQGEIVMRSWKGLQVFLSDKLVRNGGMSGKVYYTFFCAKGSIASGDKPQVATDLAGETAALQLDLRDIAKNNVAVYDRTQFVLHPQGAKWNPQTNIPAIKEAGPSNTEVADYQNWALGANDVRHARIVCLRTNG